MASALNTLEATSAHTRVGTQRRTHLDEYFLGDCARVDGRVLRDLLVRDDDEVDRVRVVQPVRVPDDVL